MKNLFSRAGLPADRVLTPSVDFNRAVEIVRNYDFIITTRFHAAGGGKRVQHSEHCHRNG